MNEAEKDKILTSLAEAYCTIDRVYEQLRPTPEVYGRKELFDAMDCLNTAIYKLAILPCEKGETWP